MDKAAAWLRALARQWVGDAPLDQTLTTSSGSVVHVFGNVAVKVHRPGTIEQDLRARLSVWHHDSVARPLTEEVLLAPDGRSVTIWPRANLVAPDQEQPWAEAGRLLAALHRDSARVAAESPGTFADLPPHGWLPRLVRAVDRASGDLRPLGESLLLEALNHPEPDVVIHGDWHLGQIGVVEGHGWQLLDVDDLGLGDPAWDLSRPAGFWAAGILDDESWEQFLNAYRAEKGPGIPATGDVWPILDIPARCAVFVAASSLSLDAETADALRSACRRMAD